MFREREPFFSLSNNQCENFETFNFGKNGGSDLGNYRNFSGSGGGGSCIQMKKHVPISLPSSCSGDEEMSISPSSSFCGGYGLNSSATSRSSESDFNVGPPGRGCGGGGGPIDRLSTMSSPCGGGGGPGGPQGVRCYGCGHLIAARYYVSAMNSTWHNECLKCHLCHVVLSEEATCFEKDGRILCKQDYHRLYQEASSKFAKRCARCTNLINANDLVMKVRDFVYHVDCFVCTICQRSFSRGDHFRMQSTDLYCRLHYDVIENFNSEESNPPPEPFNNNNNNNNTTTNNNANNGKSNSSTNKRGRPPKKKLLSGGSGGVQDAPKESPSSMNYFHPTKPPSLAGLSSVGTMSAEFNQIMDSPMNGFNMSSMSHHHHHGGGGDLHPPGMSPVGGDGGPSHQKGKRMRTTFKHNQLRVMKSYFEMNPNPDTKDLKQLSQKTGLCKRVLQVWFQNARAKHRRTCPRPDSSLSGNGVLHLEDSEEWSPQSQSFGQNSDLNPSSLPLPLIQG